MIRAGLMLAAVLALPVAASELAAPTRDQLLALLAGNTMRGIWDGRHYIQHFDPAGATRYQELGGTVSEGRWRISDAGQYCSQWPPAPGWTCYDALVSGNSVYWKSGGEYFPAEIFVGNRFDSE